MACRASKVITVYIALLLLSILSTYGLAVGSGHVGAFVPYVGYIGDQPLESTFFTQFFVIVAATLMLLVQIQYVSVSYGLEKAQASSGSIRANTAGVYVGYLGAMGLFLLACFQESHAYYVHHLGELLYLSGSLLYFALHTAISSSQRDFRTAVRLVLTSFMGFFFLVFLVTYAITVNSLDKRWEERYHWSRSDGGWFPHIIGTSSEWILIFLFQSYILTFYTEFQFILLTQTSIVILNPNEEITR